MKKKNTKANTIKTVNKKGVGIFRFFRRTGKYSIIPFLIILVVIVIGFRFIDKQPNIRPAEKKQDIYWFKLLRKTKIEYLFKGVPGDVDDSKFVKKFRVNPGIPGKKPTPLPKLVGREYFLITKKFDTSDNPDTAPYFLEFDIPASSVAPFGPKPYLECDGQCDWEIPGPFGLHGVGGNEDKIYDEGSSGCVRHSDEDITYLYNLLDPSKQEIRYYIEDM